MPFAAEARNGDDTWRKVDITTLTMPKIDLVGYDLRCPDEDCHAELVIKHGPVIAPHFAHKANASARNCVFAGGGGESQEHLTAKQEMISRLRRSPYYQDAHIEPERIMRAGAIKRIADVYVEFPDGSVEVHDAQLSKITIAELAERTNDYRNLGATNVVWWFGRANRNDTTLQQWAIAESGLVGTLDFTMQRITLGD